MDAEGPSRLLLTGRSLQQTEVLDSLNGGSWLTIGIFIGITAGVLLTLAIHQWNKRRTRFNADLCCISAYPPVEFSPGEKPRAPPSPAVVSMGCMGSGVPCLRPSADGGRTTDDEMYHSLAANHLPSHAPPSSTKGGQPRAQRVVVAIADDPGANMPGGQHCLAGSLRAAAAAPHAAPSVLPPPAVADEFQDVDMDEDWRQVLSDLDDMLAQCGQPSMSAQERTEAVRRLGGMSLGGMLHALGALRDDILADRQRS